MANPDPNHSTRFKPGASANPGGKPKPKPLDPAPDSVPDPVPEPVPEPRSLHDEVLARLLAILRSEPDVGYVLGACRLLVDKRLEGPDEKIDLESVSRAMAERYKQIRPAGPPQPPQDEPTAPPAVPTGLANDRPTAQESGPLPRGLLEAAEQVERDRAEQQRQEQAARLVTFADLAFYPFPGLGG